VGKYELPVNVAVRVPVAPDAVNVCVANAVQMSMLFPLAELRKFDRVVIDPGIVKFKPCPPAPGRTHMPINKPFDVVVVTEAATKFGGVMLKFIAPATSTPVAPETATTVAVEIKLPAIPENTTDDSDEPAVFVNTLV